MPPRGENLPMNGAAYKTVTQPSHDAHLTVLYEDAWLLAVDKPAGVLVHGDGTGGGPTLTDLVAARLAGEGRVDAAAQLQAVQRLDVETTGVVLFSLDKAVQPKLDAQVAGHAMKKAYLAVVSGRLPWASRRVEAPLGRDRHQAGKMRVCRPGAGKSSVTLVRRLAVSEDSRRSLLAVELLTGRKHQIRVHLAHLGFPLVGDDLYGGARPSSSRGEKGLLLHALSEDVVHPASGERIHLETAWPTRLGFGWHPDSLSSS